MRTAREVLTKLAEITPEEISRGLSGVPGRESITEDEIAELSGKMKQDMLDEKFKNLPITTGLMGGLGAGVGSLMRSLSDTALTKNPRSMGKYLGLGAGIGGALGLGLSALHRYNLGNEAAELGTAAGNAAQSGELPAWEDTGEHGRLLRSMVKDYTDTPQEDRPGYGKELSMMQMDLAKRINTGEVLGPALLGALLFPGIGTIPGAIAGYMGASRQGKKRTEMLAGAQERGYQDLVNEYLKTRM